MPGAALAGELDLETLDMEEQATIEAVPRQPGLPTRICRGQIGFRFIGLAPAEYTLRMRAKGCREKVLTGVIVEKGKTTWLPKTILEGPTRETARWREMWRQHEDPRQRDQALKWVLRHDIKPGMRREEAEASSAWAPSEAKGPIATCMRRANTYLRCVSLGGRKPGRQLVLPH